MFDRDYNQLNVQADVNAHFEYWLSDAINHDEPEEMIFFYHKDHLGSSTQISDGGANIIQHIEYLPYGETFFERRIDDYWTTPYKFNAKELDAETGMYYYGARYYTPEVSIWLSVDPASEMYPSTSPFMYVRGNPIRLIDPNGMWDSGHIDEFGNVIAYFDDGDNSVYVHETGTTKDDVDMQRTQTQSTAGGGTKIGELGGEIDVSVIMENKLNASIEEAKDMDITDYFFAVKTNGKWDLKNNKGTIFGVAWAFDNVYKTETTFKFGDYKGLNAADVGNYHAGFTGRYTYGGVGMSHVLLEYAAGAAETAKSFTQGRYSDMFQQLPELLGTPFSNPKAPYGDRLFDYKYNTQGMKDADKRKYRANSARR
jgi:RHS repeat-associated protein